MTIGTQGIIWRWGLEPPAGSTILRPIAKYLTKQRYRDRQHTVYAYRGRATGSISAGRVEIGCRFAFGCDWLVMTGPDAEVVRPHQGRSQPSPRLTVVLRQAAFGISTRHSVRQRRSRHLSADASSSSPLSYGRSRSRRCRCFVRENQDATQRREFEDVIAGRTPSATEATEASDIRHIEGQGPISRWSGLPNTANRSILTTSLPS